MSSSPGWNSARASAALAVKFVMETYKKQMDEGRLFLHVQPVGSRSWSHSEVSKMRMDARVRTTVGDLCTFGVNNQSPGKRRTGAGTEAYSVHD